MKGLSSMPEPIPVDDVLDGLLETALARAGTPLTAAAARQALPAGKKPAVKAVLARLRALVAAGRIHRWPGKAEKFSAVEAGAFAREQVRQALAGGPATEAEVKKQVAKPAQSLVKTALAGLIAEGVVQRHPRLGARTPYGLAPPDPLDYLRPEIEAALKRLVKRGFDESGLRAALRQYGAGPDESGADAAILAAIVRLNSQASRGALVYVAGLRAALSDRFQTKGAFDRAILGLAEQGTVQLQSHAWPGRLSDADKEALIPNGRGGYFDAIGLRLE
jgi:hypothetical protein